MEKKKCIIDNNSFWIYYSNDNVPYAEKNFHNKPQERFLFVYYI